MQVRDYKKSTGGFIHGFRYDVRALHRMLHVKYHDGRWPSRRLEEDPHALMEAVIARVNRSSALWQRFGFLCDVIVVGRETGVKYLEEMPVAHVHEREWEDARSYFTITLEYGEGHDQIDPFDVSIGRVSQGDAERSHEARYLHPVVRHYRERALVGEHHVTENLENDWTGPVHREPLRSFFAHQSAWAKVPQAAD